MKNHIITREKNNKLVLLGTKGGPAVVDNKTLPTSNYLMIDGLSIVIDCGLGVTKRLKEENIDIKKLDLIFITHLHSDHLIELGPLIHTIWASGSKKKINIYGPNGIEDYINNFLQSMSVDINTRISDEGRQDINKIIKINLLKNGLIFNKNIKISALKVKHPPIKEAFAIKFVGSKKIVFSGDTKFFLPLINFSKESDFLIHEAYLKKSLDKIVQKTQLGKKLKNHLTRSHTPLEKVIQIARKAKIKTLIINHLIPPQTHKNAWEDELSKYQSKNLGFKILIGYDKLKVIF